MSLRSRHAQDRAAGRLAPQASQPTSPRSSSSSRSASITHHHGFVRGYARDLPAFLGCWFAAALAFRLYRRPGAWRLAATWALGVPLAVLLRALVARPPLNGKEGAFLAVSLVTIAVLVLVLRWLVSGGFRLRAPRASP